MTIEPLESRCLLAAITITSGGTYTGTFDSYDASTPAITIKTTQPVVIENATTTSKGHHIYVPWGVKADLTVRNVRAIGLNPGGTDRYAGRFISAQTFGSIDVEFSYMQGTSGIYLLNGQNAKVRIVNNEAVNIDGRRTNGAGGYKSDSYKRVQFVQFNQSNVPGAEIAWNKVTNTLGKSRVEDVISVYKSTGTSANRIKIHHNLIDGAYPVKASQSFSGGGIMVEDGNWVDIFSNTVIRTTNYGIAIAGGYDNRVYGNRVFDDGKTADGTRMAAANVGIYGWNYTGSFGRNSFYDNLSGWWSTSQNRRNDYWMKDGTFTNNAKYSGTVTNAVEQAERDRWEAQLIA